MDVRSLYTSIPHKEGIKAVETTLKRKNKPTIIFNSKNYLQIKGCAMGAKCAHTYTNIHCTKNEVFH